MKIFSSRNFKPFPFWQLLFLKKIVVQVLGFGYFEEQIEAALKKMIGFLKRGRPVGVGGWL